MKFINSARDVCREREGLAELKSRHAAAQAELAEQTARRDREEEKNPDIQARLSTVQSEYELALARHDGRGRTADEAIRDVKDISRDLKAVQAELDETCARVRGLYRIVADATHIEHGLQAQVYELEASVALFECLALADEYNRAAKILAEVTFKLATAYETYRTACHGLGMRQEFQLPLDAGDGSNFSKIRRLYPPSYTGQARPDFWNVNLFFDTEANRAATARMLENVNSALGAEGDGERDVVNG